MTWGLDLLTLGAIGALAFTLWKPRSREPAPPSSVVGRPAPAVVLADAAGTAPFPLTRSLVFVFRSDCPVCAAQKSNWQSMADTAATLGFGSLAVTPEPMTRAIADYFDAAPRIPVRQLASLDALQQLGVTHVPTTLVVDQEGVVRYHRTGLVGIDEALLRTLR